MLVLSIKKNNAFFVGDNVKVTVLESNGSRAKIGIEAPRNVPVLREEVKLRIDQKESRGNNA